MEIIKEIIPSKLTNNIDNNIKLIKRKLNIYNLKNKTDYKMEHFYINIIHNKWERKPSIYYYNVELNYDFDYNLLNVYRENYYKAYKILKESLENCEKYIREDIPNSLYLFKKNEIILEIELLFK